MASLRSLSSVARSAVAGTRRLSSASRRLPPTAAPHTAARPHHRPLPCSRPAFPAAPSFSGVAPIGSRAFASAAPSAASAPESARDRKLRELFAECDGDSSGEIDLDELRRVLLSFSPDASKDKVVEGLSGVVDLMDVNGDGRISFEEFSSFFRPIADNDLSMDGLASYWMASLDLQDPTILFTAAWNHVESKVGKENMLFPRELVFLSGAPGAGKGTNTPAILREREISTEPIVMSSLLNSPAANLIKARGGLVGDFEVLRILLETLVDPSYRSGALIDGFPRTGLQVQCLKLLHSKLRDRHQEHVRQGSGDLSINRYPLFRIIVLFIDEKESVRRQMVRGKEALEHNRRVLETGDGELIAVRDTDTNIQCARDRYSAFTEQSLEPLRLLESVFPCHTILAYGSYAEVEKMIKTELSYQISQELPPYIQDKVAAIPSLDEYLRHRRAEMVDRIIDQHDADPQRLQHAVRIINESVLTDPALARQKMGGAAGGGGGGGGAEHCLAEEHAQYASLVCDLLRARGFSVVWRHDLSGSIRLHFAFPPA